MTFARSHIKGKIKITTASVKKTRWKKGKKFLKTGRIRKFIIHTGGKLFGISDVTKLSRA